MVRSYRTLAFIALLATALTACDSNEPDDIDPPPPPPPATTGTLSGTIGITPGLPGTVANTRIALFASVDDLINDRLVYQTAADGSGGYTIANIVPGTYYLEAWKDNDASATVNGPDFYAVFSSGTTTGTQPSPIPVGAGTSQDVSVTMRFVGGPAATGKPVTVPSDD